MANKDIFDRYLLALRETAINEKTEHTDRAALQALLRGVAEDCDSGVTVHHEPKRVPGKGAPDFKVSKGALILGYVENKPIGEKLDQALKSEQLTRKEPIAEHRSNRLPGFRLDQQKRTSSAREAVPRDRPRISKISAARRPS